MTATSDLDTQQIASEHVLRKSSLATDMQPTPPKNSGAADG
jgi:hypothetical protein